MTRGSDLASSFESAVDAFIALAERCTPALWQAVTPGEGWSVGAIARHVAGGMQFHAGHIVRMARGKPIVQITMDQINESNRENESALPDQDEVLAALRANRDRLSGIIRSLTDEQLDRSQPIPFINDGQVMTTADMIEHVAIRHTNTHMDSVLSVVES